MKLELDIENVFNIKENKIKIRFENVINLAGLNNKTLGCLLEFYKNGITNKNEKYKKTFESNLISNLYKYLILNKSNISDEHLINFVFPLVSADMQEKIKLMTTDETKDLIVFSVAKKEVGKITNICRSIKQNDFGPLEVLLQENKKINKSNNTYKIMDAIVEKESLNKKDIDALINLSKKMNESSYFFDFCPYMLIHLALNVKPELFEYLFNSISEQYLNNQTENNKYKTYNEQVGDYFIIKRDDISPVVEVLRNLKTIKNKESAAINYNFLFSLSSSAKFYTKIYKNSDERTIFASILNNPEKMVPILKNNRDSLSRYLDVIANNSKIVQEITSILKRYALEQALLTIPLVSDSKKNKI